MEFLPETQLTKILIFICALQISIATERCEVGVVTPFKSNTYVPVGSSVQVNCTVNSSEPTPRWSVHLVGTQSGSQFAFQESINLLNSRGFYLLSEEDNGRVKTTQLLINDTNGENGTIIQCVYTGSATVNYETSLFVYEPTSVILIARDISPQIVNVTWRSSLPQQTDLKYTLSVTSNNTQPQTLLSHTHKSSHVFTAPEGAPPCEVYNFSVTATYVGATYAGAGCSVPNPVLSRMLPSLPHIQNVVPFLEKTFDGITLKISFEVLERCKLYPIQNYRAELIESGHRVQSATFTTNQACAENLLENTIFEFQITVWNSVGSVNSSEIEIYTTDVQAVQVQQCDDINMLRLQCEFIKGSDAKGCLVVLLGKDYSHTTNFTIMKTTSDVIQTKLTSDKYSLSFYHDVIAFDIESDGSIGQLPVAGYLDNNAESHCQAFTSSSGSEISRQNHLLIILVFVRLITCL